MSRTVGLIPKKKVKQPKPDTKPDNKPEEKSEEKPDTTTE